MTATTPDRSLPHSLHHVKPRAVESIDFNGATIEALPPNGDGKAWVSVRHVCEALGIDNKSQQVKLSTKEWATVAIITTVAADGKTRDVTCIDLDSLPMWLATIEASRVKPGLRPLLLAFQRDCARVLRDHFYGPAPSTPLAAPPTAKVAAPKPTKQLPAAKKSETALERGNRTLWPDLPNDTSRAASSMTDAAFQLSCLYGHRRDTAGKAEEETATDEVRQEVEAADLHAIGQLAEAMAEEVRRRWPSLVGLLTTRRLPRARQHALALAGGVR